MKIIQSFEQNKLASSDIPKLREKGVFFYDKDKKINLVSLNFFDKLNLFFQKIFCCRASPELKLKNFTKISSSELQTIVKNNWQAPIQNDTTQIKNKIEEVQEGTLEEVQELIDAEKTLSAFLVLKKVKGQESEAVQQKYKELCIKDTDNMIFLDIFSHFINPQMKKEVIEKLSLISFNTVVAFCKYQLSDRKETQKEILQHLIDNWKPETSDEKKFMGYTSRLLCQYLESGDKDVQEAMRILNESPDLEPYI